MIECYFENGKKARGGLRHVVADCLIFDEKREKILLVKRSKTASLYPEHWVIPGGFLDRDEMVIDCARREAREETGYQVKNLNLVAYIDNPDRGDDRQNVLFLWEAVVDEKVGEHDDEIMEVKWWELDNLPVEAEWGFDHFKLINLVLQTIGSK